MTWATVDLLRWINVVLACSVVGPASSLGRFTAGT
jgi:hypothetical protein